MSLKYEPSSEPLHIMEAPQLTADRYFAEICSGSEEGSY